MGQNNFLLPVEAYQRSINPIKDWVVQTALYASRMTGKPFEVCRDHLVTKLKSGQVAFNNPQVIHYAREDCADREKTATPLSVYVKQTIERNNILAPTGTTYLHPDVKRSVIVDYLDINVKERKKYKKSSQAYEAQGNTTLYKYFHNAQDSKKRANNAVSGGFVAEGSVIRNPSAHSTLTSTTRSISSLSNASNERLIEGNRHYYNPQIALNNVISIVAETNIDDVRNAVETFGLVYPSVDDVMRCIRRSTDLYFFSVIAGKETPAIQEIRAFVEKLTPVERASVVYTGDLYHIRVLNDAFMRKFIGDLSKRDNSETFEDPIKFIQNSDEAEVNYVHQIFIDVLEGVGKDYEKISVEDRQHIASTCKHLSNTIEHYKLFIKAFFLTKNSPCTIATLPFMIRRSVVLSDTDSTMFAVDNWVEWYFGGLRFDPEGYAVGGSIMFLATQSIAHILALFSANMGVERSRIFSLAMKPEYVFPIFAQTSVAKHYYTAMKVKEGSVYKGVKMEIKGVHMKDSSVPSNIIKNAAEEMKSIINQLMQNQKIGLQAIVTRAADVEREILRSVNAGETTYLKRLNIKEKNAYKKDESQSPYQYYLFWQRVFAKTYGDAPKPPYKAVRIPLNLQSTTSVKAWIDNLPDGEVKAQLAIYFLQENRGVIKSLPIPIDYCTMHGVPDELKVVLDVKKIILTLTKSYRNILESLGFFVKRDTLLVEEGF